LALPEESDLVEEEVDAAEDAGHFLLVAYGGAGPLHATAVARELGIARVLVPRAPGHFSACGMLFSDLRHDYVHTEFAKLAELNFARYEAVFQALESNGRAAIANSRLAVSEIRISRALDMRSWDVRPAARRVRRYRRRWSPSGRSS
jgi:N-methylhydantoinase A